MKTKDYYSLLSINVAYFFGSKHLEIDLTQNSNGPQMFK